MPSTHLHPLWQVWDTALDDFFCQLPLQKVQSNSSHQIYLYRQPNVIKEQLVAWAMQLLLFIEEAESPEAVESTARLCANSLPFVWFAIADGSHRRLALLLLVVSDEAVSQCDNNSLTRIP